MNQQLAFNTNRKFGVEYEFLAFDKRNFKTHPLTKGELPKGIEDVAAIVANGMGAVTSVQKWQLTHNNEAWVFKPDSSCGIEVCTPVLSGNFGVDIVEKATSLFSANKKVVSDDHCGFHIHVGFNDDGETAVGNVISYWIKCERVFLEAFPQSRRRNKYCQMIALWPSLEVDRILTTPKYLEVIGTNKYFTLNAYHMHQGNRSTMEWRIGEGPMCCSAYDAKNWCRLVLHFADRAVAAKRPTKYEQGNNWSGLSWLDHEEVFELLGFNEPLAPDLMETRNWFLGRLKKHAMSNLTGVWLPCLQEKSNENIDKLIKKYNLAPKDMYPQLI